MLKTCPKCKHSKKDDEFYPDRSPESATGLTSWCIVCIKLGVKNRRKVDPRYRAASYAAAEKCHKSIKDQVVEAYGGKCKCCGETERKFLTMDHMMGRGNILRAQNRKHHAGHGLYYRLKREEYPKDYQVLCFNCNIAKGLFGECPHTLKARC